MNIQRNAAILSAAIALGIGGVAHASGGGHSDDNRTGYYGQSNTTLPSAVSSSRQKAAHKQVLAKEVNSTYLFAAKTVTVKVGTTITWSNRSDAEHNVTFDKNSKVNMDFEPNKSVSYTFTRTGTYRYHCEYHPFMKGTVFVHA
jgi:plastocyanin